MTKRRMLIDQLAIRKGCSITFALARSTHGEGIVEDVTDDARIKVEGRSELVLPGAVWGCTPPSA